MITIAQPVLVPSPVDWMVMQDDQHRRLVALTAGIEGEQSKQRWLSLLPATVQRFIVRKYRRVAVVVPLLAAVIWIQRFASVYRGRFQRALEIESRFVGSFFLEEMR